MNAAALRIPPPDPPLILSSVEEARVFVNELRVPSDQLARMRRHHSLAIPDGFWWYDDRSGAFGREGGPTLAFLLSGLLLGGPLSADASDGETRVFVNRRELHRLDVQSLGQLIAIPPGRYWLDCYGDIGYEGGPVLLNLVELCIARRRCGAACSSAWHRRGVPPYSSSLRDTCYVVDPETGGTVMTFV